METDDLETVRVAVECGVDIIMLDNMDPDSMKAAVEIIGGKADVECSGNITKENIGTVHIGLINQHITLFAHDIILGTDAVRLRYAIYKHGFSAFGGAS